MSIKYWEMRAEAEARRTLAAGENVTDTAPVDTPEAAAEDHTVTEVPHMTVIEEQLTAATESNETSSDISASQTEIVDLSEVRKEHDDRERLSREVEEFFEEEEKKEKAQNLLPESGAKERNRAGRILKYIFVDGLLGIPFLAAVCVLISVLVVIFSLISTALFVGAIACVAGAVLLIINSFSTVGIHPQTGFFTFGASLAIIGIGLLLFVLAVLVASKVVPFIASLVDRLARKLRLFRN